jgi:UDP-N-acetylglucosamine 2-epimerase
MREVLEKHMKQIDASDVLDQLHLEKGNYILVSAHREENIDIEENFLSLMNAINAIAEKYQMPVIYSTHPRSMKVHPETQLQVPSAGPNLRAVRIL